MKLLVPLFFIATFCESAKILGVFNHPGGSHTFLGKVLLKNLAKKGHDVTMISSFPMKENVPNYKDIVLSENLEDLKRRETMYFNRTKVSEFDQLRNMTLQHTENTFTNLQVKQLLSSTQNFDVIIMDWFFNEATLIFGHVFKAPVIFLSSFGNMALLNDFTGNTLPFSYVPGGGLLSSDDMSFNHRAIMALFNIANSLFIIRRNKAHYEILKRHFDNPPTIEELQENVALVFTNSHFSFETPRPYTPNIIPIGGFHVEELKEIPRDLYEFLDEAKEGVIYFNLGSQIKSSNLDKHVFESIVSAFRQVSQKVLWKYEGDDLTDLPKNVKIVKWAPQLEVLAHKNVKLFISHGGMLSFIEAIHFQTPLICLPFVGDQFTNAAFIKSRQIGDYILPEEITETELFNKVTEVLSNPIYQENMNYHSSLLREQNVRPLDTAIYWVEHVIKYKQGNHLKPFAMKLPWYKYYMVDVIGFFFCIIYFSCKIVLLLIKLCLKKVRNVTKRKIE